MAEFIDNVKTILDAGKELGAAKVAGEVHYPQDGSGIPFVVKGNGDVVSMEYLLEEPILKRAHVTVHDAASFVGYVNRFKDNDHSVVFADLDNRKFVSILDYHSAAEGGQRWGKHRVSLDVALTKEWAEWTTKSGIVMKQIEFARFIEDRIPNIADPPGADLLEMCLNLEAKKDVRFKSARRLDNGQNQFLYEEDIQGTTNSETGKIAIPTKFTVMLEPFRNVGRKAIEARFRYRIDNGALSLWYELVRPEDVLKDAFDAIVADVTAAVKPVIVLAGAAPSLDGK